MRWILLLLFGIIFYPIFGQNQVLELESQGSAYPVYPFLYLFNDSEGKVSFPMILKRTRGVSFEKYKSNGVPSFGYSREVHWLRFRVINRADVDKKWWLEINNTHIDDLQLYVEQADGRFLRRQSGDLIPFNQREIQLRPLLFKLDLPPNTPVDVYLRLAGSQDMNVPIMIYDQTTHWSVLAYKNFLWGIFFGILCIIVLYHLTLYFILKDITYLLYSLYIGSVALMELGFEGFSAQYLFYDSPLLLNHSHVLLVGLSTFLAVVLSYQFLDVSKYLKGWEIGFWGAMFIAVFMIIVSFFTHDVWLNILANAVVTLIAMGLFGAGVVAWRRGNRVALFYVLSWTSMQFGVIISTLFRLGIWQVPIHDASFQIGTLFQILFLAVGIGARFKQAYDERAALQAQLLTQQKQVSETELRLQKVEYQAQLNEFKTRFYTNITHEFRTPLTVILGMTEQLKKQWGASDTLTVIKRNGEQLLNLINQLLELARMDSSELPLRNKNLDLISFLSTQIQAFEGVAAAKNINIHLRSDYPALWISIDDEKLQSMITNLLSNALKFSDVGGMVEVNVHSRTNTSVQVDVTDSGVGIKEEDMPYIFDRFYQANHQRGGAGIGMSLTKELVELLGGSIQVWSQAEVGTTFRLTLPFKGVTPPEGEEAPQASRLLPIAPKKDAEEVEIKNEELPQVLVVEDSTDLAHYLEACLRGRYEVKVASDGQSGIRDAYEMIPDLIITDVMMPNADGYELCHTLKNDERTSHVPIIMLTAKVTHEDKLQGLQQGADAYLTKPFYEDELLVVIKNLLQVRQTLKAKYLSEIQNAPSEAKLELTLEDAFLLKIKQIVEARLSDESFDNQQLCEQMSLSRTQVYRKLKALTDLSPSDYIRQKRLEKAAVLLLTTDWPIAEIGMAVGIGDANYFARIFTKQYHLTPSAYRKK